VHQATAAEQAAASSLEMAAMARRIAENAGMASTLAEEWLSFSKSGRDRLERATDKFAEIEVTMDRIVKSTASLEVRSAEIDKIATTIEDLSERTHLLALNAALEAAGVKGHGKRFAIVAQAVRRLASSAAESTARIRELTSGVGDALEHSASLADDGALAVARGKEFVEELAVGLGTIFSTGEKAIGHLKEIDVMTTQQANASEQMAQTVDEAKEMARNSSNAAEEIHKSMEKITTLVDELNAHLEGD